MRHRANYHVLPDLPDLGSEPCGEFSCVRPYARCRVPARRGFHMLIVKGILLGVIMFAVFSVIYLWASGIISFGGAATSGAFRDIVTHNALYWTAGALMLALGCVIMAIWP